MLSAKFGENAFCPDDDAITKGRQMSGRLSRINNWEQLAKDAHFNVSNLAALCCVSNRQLERFFKMQRKTTPRRWLRRLQCHMAGELVSQGFSSKAAAAEVDFSNSAQFCHAFKKHYGSPPQSAAPIRLQI